jgi:tripartite-type tricarboxylate transporter receptor subunit TctC
MVTEIIGGRTQFGFLPITAAIPAIRGGKLKALAVSSKARSTALNDVPTVGEAGLPAAEFNFWIALLAPSKTPVDIVSKLNNEISRSLQTQEMRERLQNLGAESMLLSPTELDNFIRDEYIALTPVIKATDSSRAR